MSVCVEQTLDVVLRHVCIPLKYLYAPFALCFHLSNVHTSDKMLNGCHMILHVLLSCHPNLSFTLLFTTLLLSSLCFFPVRKRFKTTFGYRLPTVISLRLEQFSSGGICAHTSCIRPSILAYQCSVSPV